MKHLKIKMPKKFKTACQRALAVYRNNKPKVQTIVGIVGFTATTVGAVVATIKSEKAVQEASIEVRTAKALEADGLVDKKETREDITKAYLKLGAKLAVNYAPVVAGVAFSTFEIMHACNAMGKTISGLGAALSAKTLEFDNYRNQVIEEYGADVDAKLYSKSRETKPKVEVVDGVETVAPLPETIDSSICDLIVTNKFKWWSDDSLYLNHVIDGRIKFLNNLLVSRQESDRPGWISLVDIWDEFEYEYTRDEMLVGQKLGVLYYPDDNQNPGDNYLQTKVDTLRGSETDSIVIHFNLIYIADNIGDYVR